MDTLRVPSEARAPLTEDQWSRLQVQLQLSRREADVVRCFLNGHGERKTADLLGVSVHTVHAYVRRVYRRVGVKTRAQLFAEVLRVLMPSEEDFPEADVKPDRTTAR